MRTGLAAGKQRRGVRLDRDDLHARNFGLEHFAHAGDRPARADAGHEHVHSTLRVPEDLTRRGPAMDFDVRGVVELLRDERAGRVRLDLDGFVDGALHAQGAGREDEFGAVGLEDLAPLDAHRLGHGENESVALDRGDEGQADSGVAAGGLDDESARLELAFALGGFDHGLGDALLDARGGIEGLDLDHDFRAAVVHLVDSHERRVANQLADVVVDLFHCPVSLSFHLQFTTFVVGNVAYFIETVGACQGDDFIIPTSSRDFFYGPGPCFEKSRILIMTYRSTTCLEIRRN